MTMASVRPFASIRLTITAGLLGLACFVSGCSMPKQFQVRSGTDPAYMDDDVRFRTIYYFRVFDYCGEFTQDLAKVKILHDSLYRFRMTGKSNATTNKVRFESGTLRAQEIDPFGADVEYDQQSGHFRFKSKVRAEEETTRKEVFDDIRSLLALYDQSLKSLDTNTDLHYRKQIDGLVLQRLNRLSYASVINDKSVDKEPKEAAKDASNLVLAKNEEPKPNLSKPITTPPGYCVAGQSRRGYQIFGPEGWRTFDQDERLLLAMSSSGKPLIDTLREVADRVLNEKGTSAGSSSTFLKEQLRTRDAQRVLEGKGAGTDVKASIDAAIKAFGNRVEN